MIDSYSRYVVPLILFVLSGSVVAQGEGEVEQRLRALERENQRILERLQRSEELNVQLERKLSEVESEAQTLRVSEDDGALEAHVNALTDQMARPEWIAATKSGLPIRFYGFVRLDTYYQTARTNSVIVPAWVLPESRAGVERNDDVFAFDARLTRFAFDVDAGKIGDADVTAKLETDFANFPSGVPESRATPRIRLAYINMDFGDFTVRMGQDWDIISPLYPSVNSELLMWFNGNLGDRRPQIQLRYETGEKEGTIFTLIAAAGLQGAIDNADIDASGERDGLDAGHPHGQLRAGLDTPSWVEGKRAAFGIWGAIGSVETDAKFNGEDHFTTWVVGADWTLPLFDGVSMRGEFWYGQALRDFRGSIGQFINTDTGDEIRGYGGFAELVWQATDRLRFAVGGSMDNVDDSDVRLGATLTSARDLNWSVYVASVYDWTGGLKSGLDVIYWETHWVDEGIGNMVRINFYTQLTF